MLSVLSFTFYLDEFLEMREILLGDMPASCPILHSSPPPQKKKGFQI